VADRGRLARLPSTGQIRVTAGGKVRQPGNLVIPTAGRALTFFRKPAPTGQPARAGRKGYGKPDQRPGAQATSLQLLATPAARSTGTKAPAMAFSHNRPADPAGLKRGRPLADGPVQRPSRRAGRCCSLFALALWLPFLCRTNAFLAIGQGVAPANLARKAREGNRFRAVLEQRRLTEKLAQRRHPPGQWTRGLLRRQPITLAKPRARPGGMP
jgi:hypothetical protein